MIVNGYREHFFGALLADNVFIELLWRGVKYEKLRLWSYETVGEVSQLVEVDPENRASS